MNRSSAIASAVLLLAASLTACGGDDDDDDVPSPVAVGDTVALTASGKLVSFNRGAPQTLVGTTSVRGLASGETLLGLSVRPADGKLHAVSSAGKVYTVDASTGAVTLKSTLAADPADTTDPFAGLAASVTAAIDFNPTVDRLRLVTSTGQNLRINVDTGATTTDGAITLASGTPAVRAVAYTNSFDGATATQLFDLNGDNQIYLQNPPNNGTLATPVALGVAFTGTGGFDIDPATNLGYAVLTVGGVANFYSVNLNATANAATLVGPVAGNEAIVGLALVNATATAPTALGLTTDNRLVAFNPRTPNTIASTVAIAAPAGESVVGIDIRPIDGALYAVTLAADGSTGRVYTLNPTTGAVNLVAPISVPLAGTVFSVDFNPMANALRVLSASGQSLAVNLTTSPGTATVNGAVNLAGASAASVIGAAYLNSGVSATPPTATALYSLEASTDVLATQVVATGTLTPVGALGRDVAGRAGFDIAGSRNGIALMAFGSAATGPATLYEVNLTTGATVLPRGLTADTALVGGASGPALRDLAIRF